MIELQCYRLKRAILEVLLYIFPERFFRVDDSTIFQWQDIEDTGEWLLPRYYRFLDSENTYTCVGRGLLRGWYLFSYTRY